jgi:hypothetical protein
MEEATMYRKWVSIHEIAYEAYGEIKTHSCRLMLLSLHTEHIQGIANIVRHLARSVKGIVWSRERKK